MIHFSCSGCKTRLNVSEDKAGRKGKCPKCGTPIQIPTVWGDQGAAEHPSPQSSARPYVASQSEAIAKPAGRRRLFWILGGPVSLCVAGAGIWVGVIGPNRTDPKDAASRRMGKPTDRDEETGSLGEGPQGVINRGGLANTAMSPQEMAAIDEFIRQCRQAVRMSESLPIILRDGELGKADQQQESSTSAFVRAICLPEVGGTLKQLCADTRQLLQDAWQFRTGYGGGWRVREAIADLSDAMEGAGKGAKLHKQAEMCRQAYLLTFRKASAKLQELESERARLSTRPPR